MEMTWVIDSGRGAARAEDAQGTPTQSHISPSILVYEENNQISNCFETTARASWRSAPPSGTRLRALFSYDRLRASLTSPKRLRFVQVASLLKPLNNSGEEEEVHAFLFSWYLNGNFRRVSQAKDPWK